MSAEEIRQRGIDAVRALEGREVFPLIGELLEFRDKTGRWLAAICEAGGIGPCDDAFYSIGIEMLRHRERLAELEAARATIADTEAACFAVCKDNTREVLGHDPEGDVGRFLATDEDGDALIDAETAAEVVAQLSGAWEQVSEAYVKLQDENRELRRTVITHEQYITKSEARARRAIQCIAQEWCDELGHPRDETAGISAAAVKRLTDILMGLDEVESKAGVPS